MTDHKRIRRDQYENKTQHVSFYFAPHVLKWAKKQALLMDMNFSDFMTYCILQEKSRVEESGEKQ